MIEDEWMRVMREAEAFQYPYGKKKKISNHATCLFRRPEPVTEPTDTSNSLPYLEADYGNDHVMRQRKSVVTDHLDFNMLHHPMPRSYAREMAGLARQVNDSQARYLASLDAAINFPVESVNGNCYKAENQGSGMDIHKMMNSLFNKNKEGYMDCRDELIALRDKYAQELEPIEHKLDDPSGLVAYMRNYIENYDRAKSLKHQIASLEYKIGPDEEGEE